MAMGQRRRVFFDVAEQRLVAIGVARRGVRIETGRRACLVGSRRCRREVGSRNVHGPVRGFLTPTDRSSSLEVSTNLFIAWAAGSSIGYVPGGKGLIGSFSMSGDIGIRVALSGAYQLLMGCSCRRVARLPSTVADRVWPEWNRAALLVDRSRTERGAAAEPGEISMNSAKRTIVTLTLLCGTATATAQLGEPAVSLTQPDGTPLVDPFGGTFLAPGSGAVMNGAGWPGSTAAGANYRYNGLDSDTMTNVFSNFGILDTTEGGPFAWSATRHDNGDIDLTFGLAAPSNPLSFVSDPFYLNTDQNLSLTLNGQSLSDDGLGNGEVRLASGQLSLNTGGLPTYGWKPDVSQGVMLIGGIANGTPAFSTIAPAPGGPRTADVAAFRALVQGTAGLQNYWTFEDVTDSMGNLSTVEDVAGDNDGVVIGTVTSEPGLVGNTGFFPGDIDTDPDDGVDQNDVINNVVEIPGSDVDTDFSLQGSFSIEALVKFDTIPERFAAIIAKGDDSWRLSPDGSNPFFEPSANGLAGSTTNNFIPFADGEWHHVVFTVDQAAGVQTAWVDGIGATSNFTPGASVDISTALVLIGGNAQRGEREWLGNIDEVAVYNVALSEQEVVDRVDALGLGGAAPEAPMTYAIANVVANSADRTGVGYSMVNGLWGDANSTGRPNAMRLQISAWGNLGEATLPVGLAWFPYEQGFIGGYHTPKGLEYRNPPIFFGDTAENTGAVTDPADIEELFVLPASETIGDTTVNWRIAQASGVTGVNLVTNENYPAELGLPDNGIGNDYALLIEGEVTIPFSDTYFFGIEVDDSGLLDVFVNGEWRTIAGRRNTGGAGFFDGAIDLDAGTYPVRVRYVQRGGGGTLSLFLDDSFTFQEPLVFSGGGATVSQYDLDLLDTRSSRYVGLVDEDNDGNPDYGLGSWRVEDLARASVSRELLAHPDAVKYLIDPEGSGDNNLHARLRFDLPGITPAQGMLFVQGTESSSAPVWAGLLPPQQGDSHWEANVRRSNTNQVDDSGATVQPQAGPSSIVGTGSGAVGFVYIPYNANDLAGGYVLADGTLSQGPTGQGRAFTVTRTDVGTYALNILGETGSDGVIALMPVDTNDLGDGLATRALLSYEYDDVSGNFVIEARVWNPGDDGNGNFTTVENTYPLTDTGFYFTYVDFDSPLSIPDNDGCSPADLIAPFGIVDIDDVDAFISAFLVGAPAADFVAPFGIVDIDDVDAFITLFLAGCP